jgi:CheY-like chemotaxis protein
MLATDKPSSTTSERNTRRTKADHLILIADDEPDLRQLIGDILELEGYSVIKARDGTEALDLARRLKPNLILLDESMPGLGGREVASQLRADTRTEQVKIVILSGYAPESDEASPVAVDAYFQKPCAIESLVETIDCLLSVRT